jgi:glycosyltransferase involved in cell wall biosynthesis
LINTSIIIAAYNTEKYISRAIRSCLNQSVNRTELEIIVIDDGSTDNTPKILKEFTDFHVHFPLLRVITLEKNMGIAYACNEGIKKAMGRYIVRVDSDDFINERMVEIEQLYLDMNKDMDAVACDYFVVDEQENITERRSSAKRWNPGGTMFRKDRLIAIGLYDPEFCLLEDEDLRIRFCKKYNITRIPLPLYRYFQHPNNSTKNTEKMNKYIHKLVDKHPFLKTTPLS